jgi:hypothetical protein
MMPPLLHLIATQPQLLIDHAEGYAELVAAEMGDCTATYKRRAVLTAAGLGCLGVAAVLLGVALMLWGVMPMAHSPAAWVLVAVPLPPVLLAVGCLMAARQPSGNAAFGRLRQQIKADMALLHELRGQRESTAI